ncbi:hypothetical protein NX059_003895 [Plenodomus lindquistii]|nr:hypothetical protein NX059_003895 [Plenodomus lindquistii]
MCVGSTWKWGRSHQGPSASSGVNESHLNTQSKPHIRMCPLAHDIIWSFGLISLTFINPAPAKPASPDVHSSRRSARYCSSPGSIFDQTDPPVENRAVSRPRRSRINNL